MPVDAAYINRHGRCTRSGPTARTRMAAQRGARPGSIGHRAVPLGGAVVRLQPDQRRAVLPPAGARSTGRRRCRSPTWPGTSTRGQAARAPRRARCSGLVSYPERSDGLAPANLLLNWPTHQFQNGLYTIAMQLGDAGKTVVHTTPDVNFRVDNGSSAQFTSLAWRVAGTSTWTVFPSLVCPVVSRPVGMRWRLGDDRVPRQLSRFSGASAQDHRVGERLRRGRPRRLTAPGWSAADARPNWLV